MYELVAAFILPDREWYPGVTGTGIINLGHNCGTLCWAIRRTGDEQHMLLEYIQAALRHATYEILSDDGSYYGEISECAGVYANATTLEDCRGQLREVLEDWVLLRVHMHLPIPTIDGIELAIKEVV